MMFYRITADDKTIYDTRTPLEGFKVIDPTLTYSEDASGKLEFTLPTTNLNYDIPVGLASTIRVYKEDKEIWEGRIISEEQNFLKSRKVTCEGELGYLNDTTQPIKAYEYITPENYLKALIAEHNAKVPQDKRFTVGNVTVTINEDVEDDPELVGKIEYIYTNFENTLSAVKSLADALEGHIKVYKDNGVRKIDLIKEDYDRVSKQPINFGKNLLDFTKNWDLTDLATVVIPFGAATENSLVEGATDYANIEDVNAGKNYLVGSQESINTYGWIETVVFFDDIDDPNELKAKGQEYLQKGQFADMTLNCKAIDLKDLGMAFDDIQMRDSVRVISTPHNLDEYITVTGVTLHLDDLSKNEYTLGRSEKVNLSSRTVEANQQLVTQIVNRVLPGQKKTILQEAQEDAAQRVLSATTGKITTFVTDNGSEMFIISDVYIPKTIKNLTQLKAWAGISHFWIWNNAGFGYFVRDASAAGGWKSLTAMYADGQINAEMITTGTLKTITIDSVNIIASTLENRDGSFQVAANGNIKGATIKGSSFGNATGTFSINSSGDIVGATIKGSSFKNATGTFSINANGNIIGATIKNASGTFSINSSGNIKGASLTASVINNSNGAFKVLADGTLTATKGTIGGFNITGGKLYWGDTAGYCGAIQATSASSASTWALAIGSSSHNSYADAPFRVSKQGKTHIEKCRVINYLEVSNNNGTNDSVYLYVDTDNELSIYTGVDMNNPADLFCGDIGCGDINCDDIDCQKITCNMNDITACQKLELKREYDDSGKTCNAWITAHWFAKDFIGFHQNKAGAESANDYIVVAAKEFSVQSDSRLKNVLDTDKSKMIDVIMSLEPVTFTWNEHTSGDHEHQHMGFLAQDVNELLKSIFGENGNGLVQLGTDGDDMSFTYGLNYSEFIAPLVYTVQQQQKKIDSLEERIAKLEALIDKL